MYKTSEVINKVRKIVTEHPDAKYLGQCKYTRGQTSCGTMGCLVGQAILAIYPDLKETLEKVDRGDDEFRDENRNTINSANALLIKLGFEGFPVEFNWLDKVQYYQDGGAKWESCVSSADSFTGFIKKEKVEEFV